MKNLSVLLVAKLDMGNRYINDLYEHMLHHDVEVTVSEQEFWQPTKHYDIVHIEWIETLVNWALYTITLEKIKDVESQLKLFTSNGSKVLVTRHNKRPHRYNTNNYITQLFTTVYQYCSGIIHLGEYSIREFKEENPGLANCIKHVKIPHGNYLSLPNQCSRDDARKKLGIAKNRFVILVFGAIRKVEEQELIVSAFENATIPNKTLLVSRWDIQWQKRKKIDHWKHKLNLILKNCSQTYFLRNNFVSDNDIQMYMNAADAFFIARTNTLNSGNLYLAYSYGLPVVGPAVGNLTEVLNETGNYTYDPNDFSSATRALEKISRKNSNKDLGIANLDYVTQNGDWEDIALQHIKLYLRL